MCRDILISLHPRHSDNVLQGKKTVEIRRRPIRILPGTRVWIYTTRPRARVEAVATVETVWEGSSDELWTRFGNKVAISRIELESYLEGVSQACALVFKKVQPLETSMTINEIRDHVSEFHPPQFFKKLFPHSEELVLFERLNSSTDQRRPRTLCYT
jgi:predicted transcriptional regulator